ncbi:hypothetical protein F2Q68_00033590 [Brassica cretica]|uniref:WRKY domain-containing protein n=1 Tax=Brassica cretica TaxID=69181 RepID=A0A8S9H509_BRACR|nr:hypothetical protein F2Q68_00033590 [Brassica cretica]
MSETTVELCLELSQDDPFYQHKKKLLSSKGLGVKETVSLSGPLSQELLNAALEKLLQFGRIVNLDKSKEEDVLKRLEDNLSLMARNFNKMLKQIKKGGSRSAQKVDKPKAEEKSGSVTESKENQNTACRNEGLLRGKRGHHGTSSQAVEKNEVTKVVKRSIPVVSADLKDESQANTITPKIQDRKVVAKRRNDCHFCEPKKYGCVWIAKRDLYPKFRRQTRHGLHLQIDVSHKRVTEPVEEVICNFARIEVKEPEIINQASQKLHLNHGLSHLGREEHTADCV